MKRFGFIFLCLLVFPAAGPVALARMPSDPYESFRIKTDNIPQAEIAGWLLPAKGSAKGTLFILHGYNNNKSYMVGWDWVRDKENWNVFMIDFREHGESSHSGHISTLGYYEIWDVKAAVDYAESKGLAKPYAIFGRSLGASTGLRWASQDPRIAGVFAVSPFKNAYLASSELPADRLHIKGLPSPFALSKGFRQMLEEVDIPKAVARRNDLRIWIMAGEFDAFKAPEQQEILNASASPADLKRLEIATGCNHRNVWAFKGDATHISHDQYLRDFLKAVQRDRPVWAAKWSVGLTAVFCAAFAGLFYFIRRTRVTPAQVHELPPPASAVDPGA
jgi:pimeloyl-ACP methyl ester carboxylesterase